MSLHGKPTMYKKLSLMAWADEESGTYNSA